MYMKGYSYLQNLFIEKNASKNDITKELEKYQQEKGNVYISEILDYGVQFVEHAQSISSSGYMANEARPTANKVITKSIELNAIILEFFLKKEKPWWKSIF